MRITPLAQALLAASLLASSFGAVAATTVNGGTVHFRGEIVNAACTVSADSADQTVNLGQYRQNNFKAVGYKSGLVPFTIKLQDCDSSVATNASVAFTGNTDSNDDTVLAVGNATEGSSGQASGVGIEISDSKGTVLTPNTGAVSAAHLLKDGDNVLSLSARYKSTLAVVSAGQANADATFTLQYD